MKTTATTLLTTLALTATACGSDLTTLRDPCTGETVGAYDADARTYLFEDLEISADQVETRWVSTLSSPICQQKQAVGDKPEMYANYVSITRSATLITWIFASVTEGQSVICSGSCAGGIDSGDTGSVTCQEECTDESTSSTSSGVMREHDHIGQFDFVLEIEGVTQGS